MYTDADDEEGDGADSVGATSAAANEDSDGDEGRCWGDGGRRWRSVLMVLMGYDGAVPSVVGCGGVRRM